MKKYVSILISIMPLNLVRIFLYNNLMGYNISYSSKIGMCSVITARTVSISKSIIGGFNRLTGDFDLVIEEGTNIGSFNEFKRIANKVGSSYCNIGKNVHITNGHFFDASGGITIKEYTRIAGRGSQFWTHGGQRKEHAITIHEKCYIGSAVMIAQGIQIAENSFVGLGSIVIDSFDEANVLIAGNPAKIVKRDIVARRSLL
jgi:acetyltransferase-like isoleucine patch superfamily enzyme